MLVNVTAYLLHQKKQKTTETEISYSILVFLCLSLLRAIYIFLDIFNLIYLYIV